MQSERTKILLFYEKNKRMPTYSEVARLFSFRSRNAAYKLIQKLIKEGFLHKDKKGHLIPNKLFHEIRVLGLVEAGFPSPAEEELTDTMTLDEWLIQNREATYMLKVKGDSMQDAGIVEGDMALVDRSKSPRHGDIVIAEVDGAWTMKRLYKKGSDVRLMPENKNYKPIIPKNELKIAAVVIAIVRKYHL